MTDDPQPPPARPPGASRTPASRRITKAALDALDVLLDLDGPKRETRLTELAAADPELHEQVSELLRAGRRADTGGFMEGDVLGDVVSGLEPENEALLVTAPGQTFGLYQVERLLGSGGMGEVWLAARLDGLYEGKVALKLLHPHWAAQAAVRGRFVREGRLLSRLSHPNIARMMDAGVAADGRGYFVLEYVDGERIDDWCDARKLDVEARVRLFLKVCEAVAHAHAHLIVHRDIKPSNILVTEDGEPKLLDFGIAKLVQPDDTQSEVTDFTRLSGRVLTPEYAAPEQILGEPITVGTDVYSLGVLLYLLIGGRRPFEIANQPTIALERAVVEQEAAAPSDLRLGRARAIAVARGTDTRRLRRTLAGDLDTIVLTTLKKRPQARYASAAALAEDLQRYLDRQPILARRDSALYRSRKFWQRHRVGVSAGIAVAAALAAGVGGVAWQADVARQQARLAQAEAAKATAVKDFISGLFSLTSVNASGSAGVTRDAADRLLAVGAERIHTQMKDQPALRAELMGVIAQLYNDSQLSDKAETLYREQVAALRLLGPPARPDLAHALVQFGKALAEAGRYDESRAALQESLVLMDASGETASASRATALHLLGYDAYRTLGVNDSTALDYTQQSLRMIEAVAPNSDPQITFMHSLARILSEQDDEPAAEKVYLQMLDIVSRPPFAGDIATRAGVLSEYGVTLRNMHQLAKSEATLRAAIAGLEQGTGKDSPVTSIARESLASVLVERGDMPQAEALLRTVVDDYTRTRGADDPIYTGDAQTSLGRVLFRRGRLAEAHPMLVKALSVCRGASADPAILQRALNANATWDVAMGDAASGIAKVEEALPLAIQYFGEQSDDVGDLRRLQAEMRLVAGDAAGAEDAYRRLLDRPSKGTSIPPLLVRLTIGAAEAEIAQGRPAEAVARLHDLAERQAAQAADDRDRLSQADLALEQGRALRAAGNARDAEPELRRAVELRQALDDPGSPWLAQARATLSGALMDLGRRDEAASLLGLARESAKSDAPVPVALKDALAAAGGR